MRTQKFMRVERHPDFDKYYETHKDLVHGLAWDIAKRYKLRHDELLGYCILKLNAILYCYDEKQSAFSTYLAWSIYRGYMREFVRYESEYGSRVVKERYKEAVVDKAAAKLFNSTFDPSGTVLEEIPSREEDEDVIKEDIWPKVKEVLTPKEFEIIRLHYIEGKSAAEIGRLVGVSRQRIGQYRQRALEKLKQLKELKCLVTNN